MKMKLMMSAALILVMSVNHLSYAQDECEGSNCPEGNSSGLDGGADGDKYFQKIEQINKKLADANKYAEANKLAGKGTGDAGDATQAASTQGSSSTLLSNRVNSAVKAIKSAADAKKAASAECATWKKTKSDELMKRKEIDTNNESLDGANGSRKMHQCLTLSGNHMRYLYNKEQPLDFIWDEYTNIKPECLNRYYINMPSDEPSRVEYVNNCGEPTAETSSECKSVKNLAVQCDAAAFMISSFERDWKSKDDVKTDNVKGGNPEIKCTGSGIETLDYEGCVKFVKNGDAIDAVQGQVYQGQQLVFQSNLMDAQAKAAKSGDAVTAALTAQKDSLEAQKQMMVQRAAIDTGKLAALKSYYNQVPTPQELENNCNTYVKKAVAHFPDGTETDQAILNKNCSLAVNAQPGFAFLENQQAREKMKSKLIKVGLDVGMDGVQAYLADKQSNNINNAIAKVDSFKPTDFAGTAGNNLQVTFCQTHAGDPKCLTGGLERTFDAMGDNVVNFGEGGSGASFTNNNPYADSAAIAAAAAAAASSKSVGSIGSVVPTAGGTSGLADSAAAATVTKGNSPSGGGGGGSGGGSGGGGGGGGVPGAQPTGGVSAAIQGKTPSYGGGASGGLSMMGGNGISKAKSGSKDDGNPFGKLFNKDAKSNVMNFRDIASQKVGSKGDNLFEMISKRYTTVNTDKRLLEYEIAK